MTSMPFDCRHNLANYQLEWSGEKQQWSPGKKKRGEIIQSKKVDTQFQDHFPDQLNPGAALLKAWRARSAGAFGLESWMRCCFRVAFCTELHFFLNTTIILPNFSIFQPNVSYLFHFRVHEVLQERSDR